MGRFNKGLLFGSLFGAGLMWMSVTKKGKEFRGQIFDHASVVYDQVKEKVVANENWQRMTKTQFVQSLEEVVAEYGGAHKLSKDLQKMIVKVVGSQYQALKKLAMSALKNKK